MEISGLRKTHPFALGAAASVVVVSLVGAAAISGLLPNARSSKSDTAPTRSAAAVDRARHGEVPTARDSVCASCGTVELIRMVELKGNATGLGAIAGGLTGAVVGNQLGRGNGTTALTLLGAAGGALAGNEIEKNANKRYRYRVTVRMDDGSLRTVSQSAATVVVGERVRVAEGTLVASHESHQPEVASPSP